MPSAADLQQLLDNMKNAAATVARAAADAPRHAAIIDTLNQHLTLNDQNMNKLDEFGKLMASMDQIGNGGPVLTTTFSSDATIPAVDATGVTSSSTKGVGRIGST